MFRPNVLKHQSSANYPSHFAVSAHLYLYLTFSYNKVTFKYLNEHFKRKFYITGTQGNHLL